MNTEMNTEMKEFITPAEVGKRLGRTQYTIEKWLRLKQFPVGTAIYDEDTERWSYIIPREAFENWMQGTTIINVQPCMPAIQEGYDAILH